MTTCPHGDPLCPCPDGLLCHYEGDPLHEPTSALEPTPPGARWRCPRPPLGRAGIVQHCHLEGCQWGIFNKPCGLWKLTGDTPSVLPEPEVGSAAWICGAHRDARAFVQALPR